MKLNLILTLAVVLSAITTQNLFAQSSVQKEWSRIYYAPAVSSIGQPFYSNAIIINQSVCIPTNAPYWIVGVTPGLFFPPIANGLADSIYCDDESLFSAFNVENITDNPEPKNFVISSHSDGTIWGVVTGSIVETDSRSVVKFDKNFPKTGGRTEQQPQLIENFFNFRDSLLGNGLIYATKDGGAILGFSGKLNKSRIKSEDSKGDYDFWVIRYDADGKRLWDRTIGGYNPDYLKSILETSDGGFLLGGDSFSQEGGDKSEGAMFDGTETGYRPDWWVVKLDASGNKIWDRTYGGYGIDRVESIIKTSDGNYLIAGTSDSDSALIGSKSDPSGFWGDYWLLKIDNQGRRIWDQSFGGDSIDVLTTVVETGDRGFLVGGYSVSGKGRDKSEIYVPSNDTIPFGPDVWLVKTDAEGNKQWDKTYGGNYDDYLFKILPVEDDSYILAIHTNSDKGEIRAVYSNVIYDRRDNRLPQQGNLTKIKLNPNPNGALEAEHSDNHFSVYPNPYHSDGALKFNLENPLSYSVTISDINGRVVFFQNQDLPVVGEQQIFPGNLSDGVYCCRISVSDGRQFVSKLISNH